MRKAWKAPSSRYYYTVRSDDVKVLKSRWIFVKTKTTTPGNNIYTLLITFIAFTSFISCKFQTLFFPYKLSYCATTGPYYAWATCHRMTALCFLHPMAYVISYHAQFLQMLTRNRRELSPITNHKPWPFEPVKVKFCFLRGPLRWLTAAKNANVSWLLNFRIRMFVKSAVKTWRFVCNNILQHALLLHDRYRSLCFIFTDVAKNLIKSP